ncbi:type VI secretion system Vgr family protein [Paraburkholderia graminis]|uniref:Type VI secretion system secreted protein VgrG n=1 Tax=Paraburkholderia graminis TaxID=60548 RepID=A0ABD5CUF6_9BURK|nr:type VI secretion system tip protein TssI/VgrG [Paraburkholderia graminis]MDR6208042.1 type VI secretion system secreted protein VgrG [Paraburkholderia graminis]
MAERDPVVPLFTLNCEGLEDGTFFVVRWSAEEAVSKPYRVELTLASRHMDLDLGTLLGSRAKFAIILENGARRHYHGVLREVEQLDADGQYAYYQVVLMPRFAGLADFQYSEVYLNATLPDIVRSVLRACGLGLEAGTGTSSYDFSISISSVSSEASRSNFVCQFEESCLDFLSRRLQHEGVYYYFTQLEDQEAIVFCDGLAAQPTTSASLTYRAISTRNEERIVAGVERFSCDMAVMPATLTLSDFAGSHAALRLSVEESIAGGKHGNVAMYGEHFGTEREGRRLARLRAEAIACRAKRFRGTSRTPTIAVGYFAALSGHPVNAFNARYYVIEMRQQGAQPMPGRRTEDSGDSAGRTDLLDDYHNEFVALPAEVQFRPKQDAPVPVISGVISAVIDAEGEGPYAQINEHGCYKVRFPFGRTDKPEMRMSAWVRMASPYAGSNHGMHFPLLKETEVLVAFMNGDPDRPIIVGAVPNSENPNVVVDANVAQNAIRTAGGNVVTLDDSRGKQSIHLASPVANTSIKLGAAGQPGLALASDNHMQVNAKSYDRLIGGLYKETISSGSAGGGDPTGISAFINGAWSGGNTGGDKKGWAQATTGAGVIAKNYIGVSLNTYAASSTNIYLGNSNSVSLINSNKITFGVGININMGRSIEIGRIWNNKFVEFADTVTAKEKKTVLASDIEYTTRATSAVTDTADALTMTRTAVNYTLDALSSIRVGSEVTPLLSLESQNLEVFNETTTLTTSVVNINTSTFMLNGDMVEIG